MMQTRPGFGPEIYGQMGISCITRINGTPHQRDPTSHATCSSFASRQNCNWDGSSSSVMRSWELMQCIMSHNTRGSYYSLGPLGSRCVLLVLVRHFANFYLQGSQLPGCCHPMGCRQQLDISLVLSNPKVQTFRPQYS